MKKFDDEYMPSDLKWLRNMRERGFCVVVFTPEELEGVDPDYVEDKLLEFGWDVINNATEEEDED